MLAVPSLLAGLTVVATFAAGVAQLSPEVDGDAALIIVGWLVSGAAVVWPSTQRALARTSRRLRHPTTDELHRLAPAWKDIREQAGVDDPPYSLWVETSERTNAKPRPTYTVTVTQSALRTTKPEHLPAVLAQALAHSDLSHPVIDSLTYWYSVPARIVVRFITLVGCWLSALHGFAHSVANVVASQVLAVLFVIAVLSLIVLCIAVLGGLVPLLLLLLAWIPPTLAWTARRRELRADRLAAQLGYGAQLAAILHGRMYEDELARTDISLIARLTEDSPSPRDRLLALGRHALPSTRTDGWGAAD